MLARTWSGRTPREKADAYFEFLKESGIKDYLATPGNRGVLVLNRPLGDEVEFLLISFWESEAAIRAFAGEDMTRARYYPEDEAFLLNFSPTVDHYQVLSQTFK